VGTKGFSHTAKACILIGSGFFFFLVFRRQKIEEILPRIRACLAFYWPLESLPPEGCKENGARTDAGVGDRGFQAGCRELGSLENRDKHTEQTARQYRADRRARFARQKFY
jgi:hypothetical protein